MAVEEGTTNLLADVGVDPDFELDSNNDGLVDGWYTWVGGGGDASRVHSYSLVDGVDKGQAQRIDITATSNSNYTFLDRNTGGAGGGKEAVSPSTNYSASAYLRANHDYCELRIDEYDSSSAWLKSNAAPAIPSDGGWHRSELTITTTASTAYIRVFVKCGNAAGHWVEVDKIQLEQKSFATSFVDGTRGDGVLEYPLPSPFTQPDWTLAFWCQINAIGNVDNSTGIFCVGQYSSPVSKDQLNLYRRTDTGKAQLRYASGADAVIVNAYSGPTVIDTGSWHFYCVTQNWASRATDLYIDGVQQFTLDISSFTVVPSYQGVVYGLRLPHYYSPYVLSNLYSNMLILPAYTDASVVQEWYDLRKPFFDPAPRIVVPRPSGVSLSVA
ncbi:LamG domain-containing protein [Deferrisoma camini]|uniref:LamG-like jellyroll fold domain-containing protein n=1 Tax=Deferrisoma camini TaxID=1035120 RepID=UPI00146F89BD|nr:LamG-like jellyroll fold domain-containing protein [Deferrisoma camini]